MGWRRWCNTSTSPTIIHFYVSQRPFGLNDNFSIEASRLWLKWSTGLPDHGHGLDLSQRVPTALRGAERESLDDVFCLVKASMASRTLSQDPLLIWPAAMMSNSQKCLQEANSPTCPVQTYSLDSDRKEELRLLRNAIARDFPHMSRTAAWYKSMLEDIPTPSAQQVPRLTFLNNPLQVEDLSGLRLPARRVDPKPHELQVVFHRARN